MPGDLLLSMSVIALSQELRSAVVSVGIQLLKSVCCAAELVLSGV